MEQANEQERLKALYALNILDTAPEPELDDLVSLAAAICRVSMSMVCLIDANRQWFKAAEGTSVRQTPRSVSVCDYVIQQSGLFCVPDAKQDERFSSPHISDGEVPWRFYAGFPLRVAGGHAIGTLCVMDRKPRRLTGQQIAALRVLSEQVTVRFELRASRTKLDESLRFAEEAHRQIRIVERRFQMFMDSGPFLSYMKDADGRMLYYNEPLAKRFNVSREYMLGKTDEELWPKDLARTYRDHDLDVLSNGRLSVTQEKTRNLDGSCATWQSYKFPCTQESGQALLCGISLDISEQLAREEELVRVQKELRQANLLLEQLATKDALTGLTLRQIFDEEFRVAFREARRRGSPLSLLVLDIDNFKRCNDSFGHLHGDEVLRAVARCLRLQIRPSDLITRFGGEEFAIALPGATGVEGIALSERILQAVRMLSISEQRVTLSIGVASICDEGSTVDLFAEADQALYRAKRMGKDRVCI